MYHRSYVGARSSLQSTFRFAFPAGKFFRRNENRALSQVIATVAFVSTRQHALLFFESPSLSRRAPAISMVTQQSCPKPREGSLRDDRETTAWEESLVRLMHYNYYTNLCEYINPVSSDPDSFMYFVECKLIILSQLLKITKFRKSFRIGNLNQC